MLARSSKEQNKGAFQQNGQSKLPRHTFHPFPFEFQVLFQVVCDGREVHHLVGLCETYGIYLPQAHELGQGAEHRFHSALPFALHVTALRAFHPLDVAFVFFAIVGDAELLLLCALAKTGTSYRTIDTDMLSCTVLLLLGARTMIVEDLGERDYLSLWAQVMVLPVVVDETIGAALVGAVRRDEALKAHGLQHRIVLPAAVPRVRHTVLPDKALSPQPLP